MRKLASRTYICTVCDPPCTVRVMKKSIIIRPPDRWTGIGTWCKDGKLRPVKRGRPKKVK